MIKVFQFPRMFAIPNLSPFCCKMETWLRIAGIEYEVVDTPNPRKAPKGKLPFIEDGGERIADTSIIIEHLKASRGVDPDAALDETQRATALLVQRTLEEHYAFVLAYTHLFRDEGFEHTRTRFDVVPAFVRPLVIRRVRGKVKDILWQQGLLRNPHEHIVEAAIRDWRAVLEVMREPFFFGETPTSIDATVFGTLASSILTPIDTPIRAFLMTQPKAVAYAERMRARFFPELLEKENQHGRDRSVQRPQSPQRESAA
jgi:glutathione S-transferase